MTMSISLILQEFSNLYDLAPTVNNWYVYTEIKKGTYGLLQPGILTTYLLNEPLLQHSYLEVQHTPGLVWHKAWRIWFPLLVDDFQIKNIGKEHV